jgi:hypothetical protein
VKERDDNKVPKGAVSGVSMGDELDKFHKEVVKGVREGKAACEKLRTAITKHTNGIKTKYKPFFDRIKARLAADVDTYIGDAEKVLAAVPTYSKVREEASTQLLLAGAEFQHWEKGGSQGSFTPSNAKVLLPKLKALNDACLVLSFYTDKITEDDRKTFDKTVYFLDGGGAWNRPTMIKLIELVKKFPNNV